MTNILYITSIVFPVNGGLQRHVLELFQHFNSFPDFQCFILSAHHSDYGEIDETSLNQLQPNVLVLDTFSFLGLRISKKISYLRDLFSLIRGSDVVHLHDIRFLYFETILFSRLLGKRLIVSTHGGLSHTKDYSFIKAIYLTLAAICSIFVDNFICISKSDLSLFRKYLFRNLLYIPNWYSPFLASFSSQLSGERFCSGHTSSSSVSLLYFGRLEWSKGILQFAEAIYKSSASNANISLTVVGQGSLSLKITSLSRLCPSINYLGTVDDSNLASLILSCDFCVFPSHYEGFGLSVLEAVSLGAKCMVNSRSNYREIFGPSPPFAYTNFENIDSFLESLRNYPDRFPVSASEFLRPYEFASAMSSYRDLYLSGSSSLN